MTAVQMLTQHGGWPMSVFLTPDRRPFYGGTYFRPRTGRDGPASRRSSGRLAAAWNGRRDEGAGGRGHHTGPGAGDAAAAGRRPRQAAGPGGAAAGRRGEACGSGSTEGRAFGGAPSSRPTTPSPCCSKSCGAARRTRTPRPPGCSTRTLDKMALGGDDHIGGGFHRYSTDAVWLLPHFEKDALRQRPADACTPTPSR